MGDTDGAGSLVPKDVGSVMASRVSPLDGLDYFPTSPWATRALVTHLRLNGVPEHCLQSVWEPACGGGHMATALEDFFETVHCTDVHDYGAVFPGQHEVHDFVGMVPPPPRIHDAMPQWIITNPPFVHLDDFVQRALTIATHGVAMFVRLQALEGQTRFEQLYKHRPPNVVAVFSERVILTQNRCLDPSRKYPNADGKLKQPSTATAYCWMIWICPCGALPLCHERDYPRMAWIPPCREKMELPGDYDD